MSPEGIDPQERVYGDTYKPRPKKSSQESSPITQWQEKVQGIVSAIQKNDFTYFVVNHNEQSAPEALTSATIELLLELVGPDEPAIYEVSFGSNGGPSYAGIARNHLRAELRQSLKEL